MSASGVARLVEVMDRLRSPGGCPWDAEQTHASLARHALEEAYELVEAIEAGTRADLREELGDVLLQVVFHARIAAEHPDDPFGLGDVADAVADKLVERHPHVFGDADPGSMEDLHRRWERIKAETKQRGSVLDGVPLEQGALARAQQMLGRVGRAGLEVRAEAGVGVGERLLALVEQARAEGVDAEQELRRALRSYEAAVREAEGA